MGDEAGSGAGLPAVGSGSSALPELRPSPKTSTSSMRSVGFGSSDLLSKPGSFNTLRGARGREEDDDSDEAEKLISSWSSAPKRSPSSAQRRLVWHPTAKLRACLFPASVL